MGVNAICSVQSNMAGCHHQDARVVRVILFGFQMFAHIVALGFCIMVLCGTLVFKGNVSTNVQSTTPANKQLPVDLEVELGEGGEEGGADLQPGVNLDPESTTPSGLTAPSSTVRVTTKEPSAEPSSSNTRTIS